MIIKNNLIIFLLIAQKAEGMFGEIMDVSFQLSLVQYYINKPCLICSCHAVKQIILSLKLEGERLF